jgi:transcriptional regulator with GAF, ATPase, and Fis domain
MDHEARCTPRAMAGQDSDRDLTDDDDLLFTLGEQSDLPLLILGESGVGKSHLAKLVHDRSLRRRRPFIVADCGAMAESLFEAELFGHRRGAFTGAIQSADGLVARASGGTLFLDEIGNLPLSSQAKILRLIDAGRYRPVGDSTERVADVRVLAATNTDVERAVKCGTFRNDLYYRLAAARPMRVRPLRERPRALRELALGLACACVRPGERFEPLSSEVLDWIARQPWPGNVRQLKGRIEVAVELARVRWRAAGDSLPKALTLPDFLRAAGGVTSIVVPCCDPLEASGDVSSPPIVGSEMHREWVVALLASTHQNQSQAAQMARVSRRTIVNWIERYDLPRPRVGLRGISKEV